MRYLFLIFALLFSTAFAQSLDGQLVILVVSRHRTGDPAMEGIEKALRQKRTELGYSKEEMPLVFMGFEDSDTERKYFDRLGFQAFDSPIVCVAEWGNPARFGPKEVVNDAIYRTATEQHVPYIVEAFLRAKSNPSTGLPDQPQPGATPGEPPDADTPGDLQIVNTRFEASGKPLYMTNAGVRIKNVEGRTLHNITIRFYCMPEGETQWILMGEKWVAKIPAGHFLSRDIVGDTKNFRLVDETRSAVRCRYRIEVEQGGRVISEEGEFVPAESPVGMVSP